MRELARSITYLKEYQGVRDALLSGKSPCLAVGLSAIHRAQLAAALHLDTGRPVCVLCEDEQAAARFAKDLSAFAAREVLQIGGRELILQQMAGASRGDEQARLAAFHRLQRGEPLCVMSASAALLRTLPPEILLKATITLREGDSLPPDTLAQSLTRAGYERCIQVEGQGQFAVRGGLVDLFPPQSEMPYRIEYWDDEIDTISSFDIGSQRRVERQAELVCLPCMEALPQLCEGGIDGLCEKILALGKTRRKKHEDLPAHLARDAEQLAEGSAFAAADKYLPLLYPEFCTALDYLPRDTILLLSDTPHLKEAADGLALRFAEDEKALLERGEIAPGFADYVLDFARFAAQKRTLLRLDSFLNSIAALAPAYLSTFTAQQMNGYGGYLELAASDIAGYLEQGNAVCVVCGSRLRCEAMQDALQAVGIAGDISENLPRAGQVTITEGLLSAGFEYPTLGLVVLTEGQLMARRRSIAPKKTKGRDRVKSFSDLAVGDLVVHEHHGIGRFVGIETLSVSGAPLDYLKIVYAGADTLFIPATALDLLSKYIGTAEPEKVKLNKIGGAEWTRTKLRAKAAAKDLAEGLLKLYAAREKQKGYAFPRDDAWQQEFEDAFAYTETDDQLRCIAEIKKDMQSDRPMDRLLCGDVGFGKTEVALRAVMKCILAGKQAAILAPTTVLARQHYLTCLQRFQGLPVHIDLLTRYKTAAEQKKVFQRVEGGTIDLLIGTHKLFNKGLHFHDLGLLVVDEEQRFGVSHKEKLKEISQAVDVLTLSATPIPRTLNMALSGIRDMSTIEQPPQNRHPVQTYVLEQDDAVLLDAIRRELSRGGQVFYLHNFIDSIERCASDWQKRLPDARIGIIHGKMAPKIVSKTMEQMAAGEIDILFCTTIIETGIDIPAANTLIIEQADRMGLAQLHQIRGRVGRSSRHAFAYLCYRRGKALTEIAQKRLSAIREYAAFGSGFKIAMRDLEIRGAGNVLGPEQSGHMMSVGYDLYLKLLEQAVAEQKGEPAPVLTECSAELPIAANLPSSYVADAGQRIDLYRRIALIRTEAQRADLEDELIDRFGEPPRQATALLDLALLRAEAARLGVSKLEQNEGRLQLTLENADFARISILCAGAYRGRLLLGAGKPPYLALKLQKGEDLLSAATALVRDFKAAVQAEDEQA